MANLLNQYLRKIGLEIKKYPDLSLLRRRNLLKHHGIDLVLDVGASVGEYAFALRRIGYLNRILSFEPITKSFQELLINSRKDKLWEAFNYALGHENYKTKINISENFGSSSLLEISDLHVSTNSKSKFIGDEQIEVKKLDAVFPSIHLNEKNVYLKIDTQGFEKQVLQGAIKLLDDFISGIQIELSIVPLYSGSDDYLKIIKYLQEFNFTLYGVEPGFYDKKTGRLLQFDGIFFKEKKVE